MTTAPKHPTPTQELVTVALSVAGVLEAVAQNTLSLTSFDVALLRSNAESLRLAAGKVKP